MPAIRPFAALLILALLTAPFISPATAGTGKIAAP